MRSLEINIMTRPGLEDNVFTFNSDDIFLGKFGNQVYAFNVMKINSSILNSTTTSLLILGMNRPIDSTNVLRSGQPVIIKDNGQTIFEGVIGFIQYQMIKNTEAGIGDMYLSITLAPSIWQLTINKFIFDYRQAQQVKQLTKIDVDALIISNVTQLTKTKDFMKAIISNTDYQNIFKKTIQINDIPDSIYITSDVGQSKDQTLRSSLEFMNVVIYQQEDGEIVIRQLDAAKKCPFMIDLSNQSPNLKTDKVHIMPLAEFDYAESATLTPTVVSNYAILSPGTAVAARADELIVSYAPNPQFFPRVKALQDSGWFNGQIGQTQINQNIISNPSTREALQGFKSAPDQYMIDIIPRNVAKDDFIASYQALLTAKQLGAALIEYATIDCSINLETPNMPNDLTKVLGSCIDILNCDLKAGIVTSTSRIYAEGQAYIGLNITPLGSITGYYKS